jgi:signal transduction histidine kinase
VSDFDEFDGLVDALAVSDSKPRQEAAARLATALGCEEFLLFVLDSQTGTFVPAPGMPKTVRGGPEWRRFLEYCANAGTHQAQVVLPPSAPRLACAISTGTALAVAVGGNPGDTRMRLLTRRMPLLGAVLLSQQGRREQEAEVVSAREGAARAHSLAVALDAARLAAAELNTKLREESERKDEFLAMLAHELRNPLAPLVNSVELLRRAAQPGHTALHRPLDVMVRQLSQITRLVNDLLDVSRVSRRAIRLEREVLALDEILQAACETVAPSVEAKRHRLVVHQPSRPIYIDGDRTRLIQVFANLLNNAAKYTEIAGLITVDMVVDGSRASVVVKDNGVGIPPAMLGSIFGIFSQVHSTIHRSEGGLGIGLTLARSLVELHGGQITAHSAGPDRGSTFVVTLPAARAPTAAIEKDSIPAPLNEGHRLVRVMVVEDNADGAATMEQLLRHMNAEVRVAGNGEEALAALKQFTPELVLLDIGLPGMSGYELAARLRSILGREVQLVALTGYGSLDDQARAREAGFDEHVVKPASGDALHRLVNSRRVSGG